MSKISCDVHWKMEWPPEKMPVEQVYGILFFGDGSVLILDDAGRFNLPGGHPENRETWLQTLKRECIEEAQAEISNPMYLGHVAVKEHVDGHTRDFVQLRFVADVRKLLPSSPDPVTGTIYARKKVSPSNAARLLNWGEHGIQQLQDAEALWQLTKQRRAT